jgi:hypothetical protein
MHELKIVYNIVINNFGQKNNNVINQLLKVDAWRGHHCSSLPHHVGIILNAGIGLYPLSKSKNKSKYSATHMLQPTLIN